MANWAAGFQALGQGLQTAGIARLRKEENDLEHQRRVALEKLRQQHDNELFDKNTRAREVSDARNMAWDASRDAGAREHAKEMAKDSQAHTERMESARQGAAEKRDIRAAIESANSDLTRQLVSLQDSREKISLAKAEAKATGFADEAALGEFDTMLKQLDEREKQLRAAHAFTVRRIQSGDYGRSLSEEEVRKIVGQKPENPQVPETVPAAAPAPAAAAPAAPAPAAPAPAAPAQAARPPLGSQPPTAAEMPGAAPQASGRPLPDWAYGDPNQAVGNWARDLGKQIKGAVTNPNSATGQINQQLFDLFGG